MSNAFVNGIVSKCKNIEDRDSLIFKIVMEIHSCHQKIIHGFRPDVSKDALELLEYYKKLSGGHAPTTQKMDTVFFDCRDIAHVYSMEIDATFPLVAYPYKLYKKKKKKNKKTNKKTKKILSLFEKNIKEPDKKKDFVYIFSLLEKLSV